MTLGQREERARTGEIEKDREERGLLKKRAAGFDPFGFRPHRVAPPKLAFYNGALKQLHRPRTQMFLGRKVKWLDQATFEQEQCWNWQYRACDHVDVFPDLDRERERERQRVCGTVLP